MTSPLQHSKVRRLVAAWLGLMAAAAPAHDYRSWNPSTDDVANLANWSGAPILNGDTFLLFDGATQPLHQPTLNSAVTVGGLEFSSNTVSYALSGTGLLTIGDYEITNSSPVAQTIAVSLTLVGSGYNRINNNGTLTISGAITTNTGNGLKLAGSGAYGMVSGAIGGSKGVIKYNSGTWTMSGANTFTGNLLVEEGVLNLSGTNTTPRVEVYDGATLNLTAANTLAATTAVYVYGGSSESYGILNVNASQRIGTLESGSEEDSGFGALVNVGSGATLTIESPDDSTKTYKGTIAGEGGVTKTGSGTQIFSGDNLYSAGTTISGGKLVVTNTAGSGTGTGAVTVSNGAVLQIGDGETEEAGAVSGAITNNGAVQFDRPGSLTHGSVISGGGSVSVAAGTVTLTGANTYNGGTTVSTGAVLVLGNTSGATLATGADVTLNGTGELHVDQNQTTRAVKGDSTSKVVIAASKALTINLPDASDPTHTAATYDGTISGNGSLVIGGPGTFTLTGTNNYSGGTVLNSGTLVVSSDAALGATGGEQTFSGGMLPAGRGFKGGRALAVGDSGTRALNGTSAGLTFNGGTLRAAAGFDSGRAVLLDASGTIDTNGFNSTFSGQFTGAGGLTVKSQTGNGVLTLTNAGNQYAGGTTISSGTLKVGVTNALPTDNQVFIVSGGTLNVSFDQTLASLTGPGGAVLANGAKLTIGGGAATYNGAISGSGLLERNGTGKLTLSGYNSYAGDTLITAGSIGDGMSGAYSSGSAMRVNTGATLAVDYIETIPGLKDYSEGVSGTVQIGNSATLTIDNAGANTFTGALAGAGALTKSGVGELNFAGTSTYNGTVNVNAGTLTVGAVNAFTADSVAVNNSATFNVASSTGVGALSGAGTTTIGANQTLTIKKPAAAFGAVVGGAGGVTFGNNNNSNGFTTLTASQTYTGATTVTTGSLQLGNATAPVSVAGPVVLGSGTTLGFSHGSANSTHSQAISGGGSLIKNNSGTLMLTGSNSYTGSTTVSGGTLKVAAAGVLPATTSLSVAAGATLNVAASQTIGSFTNSFATSSIVVEAGQLLNVTLGAETGFDTGFSGAITGAGGLASGPSGTHVVGLYGANDYHGGTTIGSGGGLLVGDGGTSGMITGDIINNGRLTFHRSDSVNLTGSLSGSGTLTQNGSGQLTLSGAITNASAMTFNGSGVLSVNGLISGSGSLTKSGGGDLYLNAANAYGGGTTIQSGTLFAMSNAATGGGAVAVNGGVLAGSGTVSGAVSVNSGGTIAPGSSLGMPATLSVDTVTFEGGGAFTFQIKDATGSAGSGYSLLSSSGVLTIGANSGSPFTISVYSVNGTTQAPAANFDPTHGYSWTFATAGSLDGFSPAAFQVNTANFQNAFAGSGSFGVSQAGNSLLLNYTPAAVPEPATWALLALGLGGVWWLRRRGVAAGRGH